MISHSGHSLFDELEHILSLMATKQNLPHLSMLTKNIHVLPDFHGNRSPLADPSLKGMVRYGYILSVMLIRYPDTFFW